MPERKESDWEDFSTHITRVCLECGYRWPTNSRWSPTEAPGCPECGFSSADVLTEAKAPGWDMDEELIAAHIELEVFAQGPEARFKTRWLKEKLDELLRVLIDQDLDTVCRLSGTPASEYMSKGPQGPQAAPRPLGPVDTDLTRRVQEFLEGLRSLDGRGRANLAHGLVIPWLEEEHKN